MQNNDIEEIIPRPMTDEERYYAEQFYKEPVESLKLIEETAKFLIGAGAGTSGLYLSAFKLSFGERTATTGIWYVPFLLWTFSILALILVLLPRKYETGRNEPASYKNAFLKARKIKYLWLVWGAGFFILGILTAIFPFLK
ncbi:MAG: hypothetical protein R2941_14040 [Desulfobacterales bacterium]